METYLPAAPARILEIGAQDVNGSLRDNAPRNAEYVGLDFEAGKGVDLVVTGLDDWSVPDDHFDLVMASSVFEHDKAFWRTFLAMCAKTKPGGHIYLSAPSNGTIHRYPKDYWRFYPDSGLALEEWARDEGFDMTLVESFVGERDKDVYNDFCAVFRKGPSDADLNRDFIFEKVRSTNALTWRSSKILNPFDESEDTRLLDGAREETRRWVAHADQLTAEHAREMEQRSRQIDELTSEIESKARWITSLGSDVAAREADLATLRVRAEGLVAELGRLNARTEAQAAEHTRQTNQLEAALGELQSRLAQREEEAAQAWDTAGKHEQERDKLVAEVDKMRTQLDDANGWVGKLALARTQMERRIGGLEKALGKLSRDYAQSQLRNDILQDQIDAQSARRAEPLQLPPPAPLQTLPQAEPPSLPGQPETPAPSATRQIEAVTRSAEAAQEKLAECAARLEECYDEIAMLSDLLVAAQDRATELEQQNNWLRDAGQFLLERGKWWWRFMPLSWQRRKRDRRISMRGLFDSDAYARRYPDVSASGQDPFRHYIHHGIVENRRFD